MSSEGSSQPAPVAPFPAQPPAPESAPGAPAQSADLFDYRFLSNSIGFALRAPLRHKVLASVAFLLVMALGGVAVYVLPFRYQVQARILAQRNPVMSALSNPGLNRNWDAPTVAAREILVRRDNLIALCKQTNFVERYLTERAPAVRLRDWISARLGKKEADRDKVLQNLVDALEDRLKVSTSQEGTVTISFEWSNPESARLMVQAAVQSFLESRYASEISAVGETIAILRSHDAQLQNEIAASISQLTEKRKANRPRLPQAAPRIVSAPRIAAARVTEDENVTRLRGILAAKQRALTDLEGFRQRRLEELQAQLTKELLIYAPRHPEVLNTTQAIESFSRPSRQVEDLKAEVEDLQAEMARKTGYAVASAPAAVPREPPRQQQLEPPPLRENEDPQFDYDRSQVDLLLRQHAFLLDRIDAAQVEMDTAQAAFKYRYSVITPPQLPRGPIKNYRAQIVLASLLVGLVAAIAASTIADRRSKRLVERWQVEHGYGIPVLAMARR